MFIRPLSRTVQRCRLLAYNHRCCGFLSLSKGLRSRISAPRLTVRRRFSITESFLVIYSELYQESPGSIYCPKCVPAPSYENLQQQLGLYQDYFHPYQQLSKSSSECIGSRGYLPSSNALYFKWIAQLAFGMKFKLAMLFLYGLRSTWLFLSTCNFARPLKNKYYYIYVRDFYFVF